MSKYIILLLVTAIFAVPAFSQNGAHFSDIKPGMKDAYLEQEAVRLANKRAMEYQWPERFLKAKIISGKWENVWDCYGDIIARKIHLEMYVAMNSGNCAMGDLTFKEKPDEDGKYSRILFLYDHIGDLVNIECE